MAYTRSEGTGRTPDITETDRRIFELGQTMQAEVAARRLWLHIYPGESMRMLRWVMS